jgi:Na+/proline symporter
MTFFTTRPLWVLTLLLILFTALAMLGPVLIRRRVGLEKLRTNNEVAGFKFAAIGVLYAVLLAFVVIITWERFNDAEKALVTEAGAATTLYRLSTGVDQATGVALRNQTTAYLQSVLEDDWPAMAKGHWSRETTGALNNLYGTIVHYRPADLHDADLQQDLLREVDKLTEARRARIVLAPGTVPNAIWFVLFLGAVLTISFTFFFGTQNVITQCLMTGVLAALIFSAILVVIAIDRPFTGAVMVPTESIRTVLQEFEAANSKAVNP